MTYQDKLPDMFQYLTELRDFHGTYNCPQLKPTKISSTHIIPPKHKPKFTIAPIQFQIVVHEQKHIKVLCI